MVYSRLQSSLMRFKKLWWMKKESFHVVTTKKKRLITGPDGGWRCQPSLWWEVSMMQYTNLSNHGGSNTAIYKCIKINIPSTCAVCINYISILKNKKKTQAHTKHPPPGCNPIGLVNRDQINFSAAITSPQGHKLLQLQL